jgi:hypothetical protein
MDKSYLSDLPEVVGHTHEAGHGAQIPHEGDHRDPVHVTDDDTFAMQQGVSTKSPTPDPRADQVDDVAIEYLDGQIDHAPRTLAHEHAEGGYAQEGDQSYPASGPRETAGMRGAADIGKD